MILKGHTTIAKLHGQDFDRIVETAVEIGEICNRDRLFVTEVLGKPLAEVGEAITATCRAAGRQIPRIAGVCTAAAGPRPAITHCAQTTKAQAPRRATIKPPAPPARPATARSTATPAADYTAAVQAHQAAGMTASQAYAKAAHELPQAHAAWNKANTAAYRAARTRPEAGAVSGDDGRAETYQAMIDAALDAGESAGKAHHTAAVKFPQSHRAWLAAGCPRGRGDTAEAFTAAVRKLKARGLSTSKAYCEAGRLNPKAETAWRAGGCPAT